MKAAANTISYAARRPRVNEFQAKQHAEVLKFLSKLAREQGREPNMEEIQTFSMVGMSMFLPVEGWDEDDYGFRGPAKSVREVKDVLGQDGWLVRATILRLPECDTEDVDLAILITRRAWQEKEPPAPGQDIEGRLWLQGYLWYPHQYGSIGS